MSLEQLLLFGLLGLVALTEFIVRRLRSRRRAHGAGDAVDGQRSTRPAPSPQSRRMSAPPDRQLSPPRESLFREVQPAPPPPTAVSTAQRREWARPPLGTRADLRRAIVLMTVLGPPAAQGPGERRGP